MVSKENQTLVFAIMVELIEEKCNKKKMVSIFDIAGRLNEKQLDAPKLLIEACLDVLIQHKYVRYYKNDKGYVYYGITQLGWTRWDKKINDEGNDKVSA